MSKGMKTGGMRKGFKYSYKRFWFNNGVIESLFSDVTEVPSDWVKGRLKRNRPAWNKGLTKDIDSRVFKISVKRKEQEKIKKCWINNGKQELRWDVENEIPSGWIKGRLIKHVNSDFNVGSIDKDSFLSYWKEHKVSDCYKEFNISRKELLLLISKYNLDDISEHTKRIRSEKYTSEWRQNHSNKLKGKNTWSKGRKHSIEQINKFKEAYKNRSIDEIRKSKYKEYLTRKNNGSYLKHMTKAEKIVLNSLKSHFKSEDISYLYFDENRYPFECDFYVKSKDLFIEVNIYPSHGGKPFENTEEDNIKLNKWKDKVDKGFNQYKNWIYTWTDLDVRKKSFAIKYNLNYLVLYSLDNLEDILNEISQD